MLDQFGQAVLADPILELDIEQGDPVEEVKDSKSRVNKGEFKPNLVIE